MDGRPTREQRQTGVDDAIEGALSLAMLECNLSLSSNIWEAFAVSATKHLKRTLRQFGLTSC